MHGHHVYGHVSNESFMYIGVPASFLNAWQKGKTEPPSVEELLRASDSDSLEDILDFCVEDHLVTTQLLPDAHTLNLESVPKATDALLAYMAKIGSSCAHIEKVVLGGCKYVVHEFHMHAYIRTYIHIYMHIHACIRTYIHTLLAELAFYFICNATQTYMHMYLQASPSHCHTKQKLVSRCIHKAHTYMHAYLSADFSPQLVYKN